MQVVYLRDISCCETGYNPATGRPSPIGQDFVYKWDPVREYAARRGFNLDSFLVLPIAARLFEKNLRSSVLFWFAPMNDVFVVTVCSRRNVDFMNPPTPSKAPNPSSALSSSSRSGAQRHAIRDHPGDSARTGLGS